MTDLTKAWRALEAAERLGNTIGTTISFEVTNEASSSYSGTEIHGVEVRIQQQVRNALGRIPRGARVQSPDAFSTMFAVAFTAAFKALMEELDGAEQAQSAVAPSESGR